MGEKAVFTAAERRRVIAIDRREVDIRKEGRRGSKIFCHPPPFGLVKDLGRGLGVHDRTLGNMAPGSTDTESDPATCDFADRRQKLKALPHYSTAK
jgi:hypothetical protein